MSEYTVYLDQKHRIVPLSQAHYVVTTAMDDEGRVLKEEWQRVVRDDPTLAQYRAAWEAFHGLRPVQRPIKDTVIAAAGTLLLLRATYSAIAGYSPIVSMTTALAGAVAVTYGLVRLIVPRR